MVPMGERALTSRKRVNLIDMKRGQNAGIALARIKMSFAEVKERISLMDDEIFTTDQLRSLSVSTDICLVRAHSVDVLVLSYDTINMLILSILLSSCSLLHQFLLFSSSLFLLLPLFASTPSIILH